MFENQILHLKSIQYIHTYPSRKFQLQLALNDTIWGFWDDCIKGDFHFTIFSPNLHQEENGKES